MSVLDLAQLRKLYDHRKSIPWEEVEFVTVDGVPLIYEMREASLVVIFPGGRRVLAGDLMLAGHRVVMPKKIRRVNYA